MKIATRAFVAEIGGERIDITEGERVDPSHDLVRRYPQHFRTRELAEELALRSARIADLHDDTRRVTSHAPLTERGRREREEANFWNGVQRQLERTAPDRLSSAERREQDFYDQAIAQFEQSGTRELADFNADVVRDYGFDRGGWSRRTAD
jgi:hypothetical protein